MARIKLSGHDYRYVLGLEWPDSWEAEGVSERINGGEWTEDGIDADALQDHDIVEIDGGFITTWNENLCPPRGGYVGWVRANLLKMSERRISVTCDAEKLDAVISAIKAAGGKV